MTTEHERFDAHVGETDVPLRWRLMRPTGVPRDLTLLTAVRLVIVRVDGTRTSPRALDIETPRADGYVSGTSIASDFAAYGDHVPQLELTWSTGGAPQYVDCPIIRVGPEYFTGAA